VTAEVLAAEAWFRRRGLPWFVDAVDDRVRELLGRRRLWLLLLGVVTAGVLAGVLSGLLLESTPTAVLLGVLVALALLLAYAGGPLRVAVIARWAARRALAELDLMLPLVTRALPLLLLFMTFLFINTEVWQVASALPWSSLLVVMLLFTAVGVTFLLTRLPEEVREVQRGAAGDGVAQACRGTPLEDRAAALARDPDAATRDDPLTGTQRANLLLVLLVMQAFQVFLLGFAVFVFFVVFGLLAIRGEVVQAWIGHAPAPLVWHLPTGALTLPVSGQLCRVSLFLSAFAALYFTVYAVTDSTYRTQFLGELSRGLEQAIGVRVVYRTLLARGDG
jgi:hypothetical protein